MRLVAEPEPLAGGLDVALPKANNTPTPLVHCYPLVERHGTQMAKRNQEVFHSDEYKKKHKLFALGF